VKSMLCLAVTVVAKVAPASQDSNHPGRPDQS
jgi:hypothetical protein